MFSSPANSKLFNLTKQWLKKPLLLALSLGFITSGITLSKAEPASAAPKVRCLERSGFDDSSAFPGGPNGTLDPWITNVRRESLRQEVKEREKYLEDFVDELNEKFPDYNIVIAHKVDRVTGSHYSHTHCELNAPFARTIGYEVYLSLKGKPFTFVRGGDGGYRNWRYNGNFKRNDNTLRAR